MDRHAARLGGHHQPRRRADPRRPHAGRPARRDGPPPGAAARGRQLRLAARLREGPRRGRRPDLAPLPSLLIVVDEFSELLSAKPEFVDLFVTIGRLGRSLGVHLLLASQRLEEGRLRGLDSHLSYRIGLRTFSAGESRGVIGVPDAYELPAVPGLGFLSPTSSCCGSRRPTSPGPPAGRRRRAQVAGSHRRREASCRSSPESSRRSRRSRRSRDREEPPSPSPEEQRTVFDIAVDRHVGHGPAAAPRLAPAARRSADTFDQMLPDLAVDPELGLISRSWRSAGRCGSRSARSTGPRAEPRDAPRRPLRRGRPRRRRRAPQSGKSTLLRTLDHRPGPHAYPSRGAVLLLDFGGGALAASGPAAHRRGRHPVGVRRGQPDRRRGRRRRRRAGAVLPRPTASTRSDLPQPPGAGDVDDQYGDSSWWSTAGARSARTSTSSRASSRCWPSAA